MSGGFFRGTSADQDTRFSNKQAKLMKSQKFPPELEHLVDMTKVKLEVLKPWIANRVTELIGFEDEVLINFIYTLLDGKLVNGKEVQISLTGFMERNTGKFMKELWSLLLSAQQNTSGVPQQFLDAKEEETRKKQAETDRITNEIERKREKEKREIVGGSLKNMDGNAVYGRSNNASLEPKRQYRTSSRRSADEEKESDGRSGSRGRGSSPHSPRPADVSPPPRRKRSRSRSKSFSNSRSRSNERLRSRKASRSPQSRGRSISSERRDRSPPRRSISPRRRRSPRRYSSPPRRRYPNSRRRSISPSRYRSPSPRRQRMQSPLRRRYRSPIRRRSRSPINRRSRSPVRQRSSSQSRSISRSPVRRRSPPFRRRSRTPVRQRSPIYIRRRSPPVPRHQHRRSPSPRRRSPSQLRRRSPTFRRRSVSPRPRSLSPQDSSSPSAADHSSPSPPIRRSPEGKGRSPARSPAGRIRVRDKYSPARNSSPSEDADRAIKTRRGSDSTDHHRNSPEPSRSSQRDSFDRNGSRRKLSPLPPPPPPPPRCSPSGSKSPPVERRGSYIDERVKGAYEHSTGIQKKKVIDSDSPKSPPRLAKQKVYHDNSDSSMDGAPTMYISDKKRGSRDNLKGSSDKVRREGKPADKIADDHTGKLNNHSTVPEPRKKVEALKSDRPGRLDRLEASDHKEFTGSHRVSSSKKKEPYDEEGDRTNKVLLNDIRGREQKTEVLPKSVLKGDRHDQSGPVDSNSDESDKERTKGKDKRKHRKSEKDEVASDDDSSSDSYVEDRKDSKRKRKEEKKLKKEERRRRREERRRRKEEKRAEKRRRKLSDATAPPSDSEGNFNSHSSDDEHIRNQKKRSSGIEHKETDPKELEIALREKALESLRAKKGIAR